MKEVLNVFKKKWYLVFLSLFLSLFLYSGGLGVTYVFTGFFVEFIFPNTESLLVGTLIWILSILMGGLFFSFFTTIPLIPIYLEIGHVLGNEMKRKVRRNMYIIFGLVFVILPLLNIIERLSSEIF